MMIVMAAGGSVSASDGAAGSAGGRDRRISIGALRQDGRQTGDVVGSEGLCGEEGAGLLSRRLLIRSLSVGYTEGSDVNWVCEDLAQRR